MSLENRTFQKVCSTNQECEEHMDNLEDTPVLNDKTKTMEEKMVPGVQPSEPCLFRTETVIEPKGSYNLQDDTAVLNEVPLKSDEVSIEHCQNSADSVDKLKTNDLITSESSFTCSENKLRTPVPSDSEFSGFSTAESSDDESGSDSDSSSVVPKIQLPAIRPGFRPRARMFKATPSLASAGPAAPAAPHYMIDVPEMWGVGADGSIMEVFNKLELNK